MKTVILAGGVGTRLAEETEVIPKPMVQIGGMPILWHIMKHYAHYGHKEFYLALGYKGEIVKNYFMNYYRLNNSMTVDLRTGRVSVHERRSEDWRVHMVDTGANSNTGGRILRMARWLKKGTFLVTYGDGVSDVDLDALVRFHRKSGRLVTTTAVRPPARFGGIVFDGDMVARFTEKPTIGEGWINGGFLVCEPGVFDYLKGDETSFEADTLERLVADGQLAAYRHDRFWQCMDTLRDKRQLESLWSQGNAPWKVWS
jgi:glucose-1-phosphate cytidylyltransferase